MRPTYKQQYDKIIDAYFKDEINPTDSNFCICGTLSPTRNKWNAFNTFSWGRVKEEYLTHKYDHYQPYTIGEYKRMEWALISNKNKDLSLSDEDALFNGMRAALEELKKIHIEGGEVIDEVPTFTKRQLQTI